MAKHAGCPDCGAHPGEFHDEGCDREQCSICGRQRLSCLCRPLTEERLPWEGEPWGVKECRKFGWYAVWDKSKGRWIRCTEDTWGRIEDLNRLLSEEAYWSPEKRQFVQLKAIQKGST